jgi:hypothetical protein
MEKIEKTLGTVIRGAIILALAIVIIVLLMSLRGCFSIPYLPPMLQCPVPIFLNQVGPPPEGPHPPAPNTGMQPNPAGPGASNPSAPGFDPNNPNPGTKDIVNPGPRSDDPNPGVTKQP